MARASSKTPPLPWTTTGWHDNLVIEFTLFLPGAARIKIGRRSPKEPWFWRNEFGARVFDEARQCFFQGEIGPYPTADAAAADAERQLASLMRSGMRQLKGMRAA